jgi:integrase
MSELRVENVNFETKRFEINSVTAKNSKFEVVPIPPQLLKEFEFIKKYPGNYFLFGRERLPSPNKNGRDTLSYRHKKFTDQLGLKKGHTFYSWKNTGAVEMVKTGTHLKIISMLMRHSSLEITQDYLSTLGIDDLLNQIQINYPDL